MAAMRIVLDTNIWLDWLVFRDLSLLHLKKVVSEGQAEIFIDAPCEAELERVLAYDLARHTLAAEAQAACLVECRRLAKRIDTVAPEAGRKLLMQAAEAMRLSARGYTRMLRVARTIADLAGVEGVGRIHVAEALSYRRVAPRA